jgi:hypothetical protein
MRVFILEDDENRIVGFEHAGVGHDLTIRRWNAHADGAYAAYEKYGPFDLLLLDHDLGGRAGVMYSDDETGTAFVKWLGAPKNVEEQPTVIIHSWNPGGARNMRGILESNGWKKVLTVPFGVALLMFLAAPTVVPVEQA